MIQCVYAYNSVYVFLDCTFLSPLHGLANASFGASICIDPGLDLPTDRCCSMFRGVRQVVPSGSQSLRRAMPSVFSMDEGLHWMIISCTVFFTGLTCTCRGSFSNCGNLSHPGQHPVSIGLASDGIINTLDTVSLQPLNMAKGFDCKDSCGCLLNFPTFLKDIIECLMDTVRSPWSRWTCLEFPHCKGPGSTATTETALVLLACLLDLQQFHERDSKSRSCQDYSH